MDLNQNFLPKSVIPYLQWVKLKPSIATLKIKGSIFSYKNNSFNLAVGDMNQNGIFNEVGIDHLFIAPEGIQEVYIHDITSISVAVIQDVNYFEANGDLFKISKIDPKATFINLVNIDDREDVVPSMKLIDKLPNIEFSLLDGSIANFKDYQGAGKLVYVDFWGLWCEPCLKAMEDLKKIAATNRNITIISLNSGDDIAEIKKYISKKNINWINGISTKSVQRHFHQNGFPYGALFDIDGKIIKMGLDPIELNKYLN
ncbi:MAG: TlpA family protein disulfide reductase [Saprospiraceae bacterium]|nr:TlpA family protein disulfide reductase [Saprospiraceae bacterium]MCB9323547.1 TlpA family protein disulfide reductase [Lewinellaceae bacterium]